MARAPLQAALDELVMGAVTGQAGRAIAGDQHTPPVTTNATLAGLISQFRDSFSPDEVKESVNYLARFRSWFRFASILVPVA